MKGVRPHVAGGGLGPRLRKPCRFVRNPAMDHGERYLGMELKAESTVAKAQRLVLKNGAFGQGNGAMGERKPFPVPLINVAWPGPKHLGLVAGCDGLIASFDAAGMVRMNARPEILGQHLCAKADPEDGFALGQWYPDPVDLFFDIAVRIVRTHGAAENNGAGMAIHRPREGIAETRPANVERDAIALQIQPDRAWLGL